MDETPTIDLVRAAQEGDDSAMNSLFKRYLSQVRQIVALRMGWRLRQLAEMEDVVQETMMKVFQGLKRFDHRSDGSFRSWVAHCVQCEVIDMARRADTLKRGSGRVKRFSDFADVVRSSIFADEGEESPSKLAGAKELEEKIETALLGLPGHDRELIVLRNLCEMSFEEIAETMEYNQEAAARKAFSRALAKLHAALEE